MTQPPRSNSGELTSWKEIAAYLEVSQKTAQLWEQHRGLPVHRLPGPRARVWALVEEIEAWKISAEKVSEKAGPVAVAAAGGGAARAWWPKAALAAGVVVAMLVGWGAFALGEREAESGPAIVQVDAGGFTVRDGQGREMWRYGSPYPLNLAFYDRVKDPRQLAAVVDLDGDGEREVLYSGMPASEIGSAVICFDGRGREKWRHDPGRDVPEWVAKKYPPPYRVVSFLVLPPAEGGRASQVLVSSIQYPYYPARLELVSAAGRREREFWHTGHLHRLARHEMTDGRRVVLVGGINNQWHDGTLLALDPERMAGSNGVERWGGPAAEGLVAVLRFPRTCVSKAREAMNEVAAVISTADGVRVSTWENHEGAGRPSIEHRLTRDLEHVETGASSLFEAMHERFRRQGEIDHDLTSGEIESWKPVRVGVR